jgi:hypothetical protein
LTPPENSIDPPQKLPGNSILYEDRPPSHHHSEHGDHGQGYHGGGGGGGGRGGYDYGPSGGDYDESPEWADELPSAGGSQYDNYETAETSELRKKLAAMKAQTQQEKLKEKAIIDEDFNFAPKKPKKAEDPQPLKPAFMAPANIPKVALETPEEFGDIDQILEAKYGKKKGGEEEKAPVEKEDLSGLGGAFKADEFEKMLKDTLLKPEPKERDLFGGSKSGGGFGGDPAFADIFGAKAQPDLSQFQMFKASQVQPKVAPNMMGLQQQFMGAPMPQMPQMALPGPPRPRPFQPFQILEEANGRPIGWHYMDHNRQTYGPFPSQQMDLWYSHNHFDGLLPVSSNGCTSFEPLSNLVNRARVLHQALDQGVPSNILLGPPDGLGPTMKPYGQPFARPAAPGQQQPQHQQTHQQQPRQQAQAPQQPVPRPQPAQPAPVQQPQPVEQPKQPQQAAPAPGGGDVLNAFATVDNAGLELQLKSLLGIEGGGLGGLAAALGMPQAQVAPPAETRAAEPQQQQASQPAAAKGGQSKGGKAEKSGKGSHGNAGGAGGGQKHTGGGKGNQHKKDDQGEEFNYSKDFPSLSESLGAPK